MWESVPEDLRAAACVFHRYASTRTDQKADVHQEQSLCLAAYLPFFTMTLACVHLPGHYRLVFGLHRQLVGLQKRDAWGTCDEGLGRRSRVVSVRV